MAGRQDTDCYFDDLVSDVQTGSDVAEEDSGELVPGNPWSHLISLQIAPRIDEYELKNHLDRFLKMCPMISLNSPVEVHTSDEVRDMSVHEIYNAGKYYVFVADGDEPVLTYAFAIKENFKSASQVMKFLGGLAGVTGDVLENVCIWSAEYSAGVINSDWKRNMSELLGGYQYIRAFATGDMQGDSEVRKVFPLMYGIVMRLFPDESVYEYMRKLSGGYVANQQLIQDACDGFSRRFGGDASEFNLPSIVQKDVNMHRVKFLEHWSPEAAAVRFMTRRVDQEDPKAKFHDYDSQDDIVALILDRIKAGDMRILKSRQIQASVGMYVVFNLGTVWVPREREHYYVLMQIKCDVNSGNIWDVLRKYIVIGNYN